MRRFVAVLALAAASGCRPPSASKPTLATPAEIRQRYEAQADAVIERALAQSINLTCPPPKGYRACGLIIDAMLESGDIKRFIENNCGDVPASGPAPCQARLFAWVRPMFSKRYYRANASSVAVKCQELGGPCLAPRTEELTWLLVHNDVVAGEMLAELKRMRMNTLPYSGRRPTNKRPGTSRPKRGESRWLSRRWPLQIGRHFSELHAAAPMSAEARMPPDHRTAWGYHGSHHVHPLFHISDRVPVPPGRSPFHFRGTYYDRILSRIDMRPGGSKRLFDALGDPELVRFFSQRFSWNGWYDALPSMPLYAALARIEGRDFELAVREPSRVAAQSLVPKIFRYALSLTGSGLISSVVTKVVMYGTDFARVSFDEVGPGIGRGSGSSIPLYIAPNVSNLVLGWFEGMLHVAGAKDVEAKYTNVTPDGERSGFPTVTVSYEFAWSVNK